MGKSIQVGPNAKYIGGTLGTPPFVARTITAPTTVVATDELIMTDSTAGGWTQNLPLSSTVTREIIFSKTSADANSITITPAGSDLINGLTSYALSVSQDFVRLGPVSGGWRIIGKGTTASAGSATYLSSDPRFYTGCSADGVHDDSAYVSSAIATNGLFLQAGITYAVTWSGISTAIGSVTDGFQINGGGTLLLLSGGTSLLTFSGTAIIKLIGITLDGNGMTGSNPLIMIAGGQNIYFTGLTVKGFGTNPALGFSGSYTYSASQCHGGIIDQGGLI